MDSSSVDDDLPIFSPPAPGTSTSTPRLPRHTSKRKFQCPHCSKTYVSQSHFKNHVASHSHQSSNDTAGSSTDLDISNLSFSGLPDPDPPGTWKVPAVPKKKGTVVRKKKNFVCTYCLKAYVSEIVMRKHLLTHTMQEAASKFPDKENILKNAENIGGKALISVSVCPRYGPSGTIFSELIGHVDQSRVEYFNFFSLKVLEELMTGIDKKKSLLPSPLMKALFEKMEGIICDEELCDIMLSVLELDKFDGNVQSQFLLEFLLCVTTEVFKFIADTFRVSIPTRRTVLKCPELDQEDKQVIYYIGGAIVRGYLRIAYRHKNNLKWRMVAGALRDKILASQPVDTLDCKWTKDLDRGALLYINEASQNFFLELTKVVYSNEKKDGSIDYDQVISIVTETDISVQWDRIISDSLSEDVSVGLMNDVVLSFCRACGRGIAKRRLHALRAKPLTQMPTRHHVASRKT